jgi:hypothetical protein
MPGGAPLRKRSTRPCKYGPRTDEGKCPPKPKSTKRTSRRSASVSASGKSQSSTGQRKSASKKPCKYGERINGKCPPKPKAAATVKQYKSVDRAAEQAGAVLASKKATRAQKGEAVKVLGTAVAGQLAQQGISSAKRQVKTTLRKPATKKAIKAAAPKIAKAAGTATAIGAVLVGGATALAANRERECRKYAEKQLAATKKRLPPGSVTPEMEATLRQQYFDHCSKQPVQNPYLGK